MEYQVDTRNHQSEEVRVGLDQEEVAVFRRVGFFVRNLTARMDGVEYQMKLPAPWNGFLYRLRRGDQELANAKKKRKMHAFEPDRPLIRHMMVEFEIDIQGRTYRLTPEDRHGTDFVLREGEEELGRLTPRTFEEQRDGTWEADLRMPADWSIPHAAFLAWLVRDGRSGMGI